MACHFSSDESRQKSIIRTNSNAKSRRQSTKKAASEYIFFFLHKL